MHEAFMHRCLALAERGRGKVGTNPMVGALLVREGKIIAEAWHEKFGGDHAERALLKAIKTEILPTDILYVNLEPCCHTGKTPPCTDIMIERGVKRVVYGMVDPDPAVSGKGILALERAGVELMGPVNRALCEWMNRGFVSLRTACRPWVTIKRAQTPSGEIASADGKPVKITSREQDVWSHTWLRARHDAILVGVGTIIADNPFLDKRFEQVHKTVPQSSDPLRIILDPHLRIPLDAKVVTGKNAPGTMVITSKDVDPKIRSALQERGVRVEVVSLGKGTFDFASLWEILTTPKGDFHGIASVLVEGGVRTWRAFKDAEVVDEEVTLIGR
ncbi:MAG: bifunctional diaminohydroxyphosphoribosylaminopyrimidine deaminase/5-amino-6-(5-phosphoribosylamino)uracil reductase RibD [Candidatus Peregrinibacteria bacterium]